MESENACTITGLAHSSDVDCANECVKNHDISKGSESLEKIDDMEKKHFQRIVHAFKSYEHHSLKRLFKTSKYIKTLPTDQQELLKEYTTHLGKVQSAIEHNFQVIQDIIKDVEHIFLNADLSEDIEEVSSAVTLLDIEKVQSIFKQLYREWSSEGKEERDASFKPILDEISFRFPYNAEKSSEVQILVPGAGLGRLPFDIAKRGYSCQGNEYSLIMLFASNFVLNRCPGADMYKIYPWVHQYHNNLKSSDQIKPISFPDVNPTDLSSNVEFSMAAGSFMEIYNVSDVWDCICTCFFLDTANNVIDYIAKIWKILKPGGYWINLGPLLYHHADVPNEDSIEPSYEEIRSIILKFGFTLLREEFNLPTPYSQNPRSMISYEYRSVFFVSQKPDFISCIKSDSS